MQTTIEISEHKSIKKRVDIELPFYFSYDYSGDYGESEAFCVFLNKVKDNYISVHIEREYNGSDSFKIEIESLQKFSNVVSYDTISNAIGKDNQEKQRKKFENAIIKVSELCLLRSGLFNSFNVPKPLFNELMIYLMRSQEFSEKFLNAVKGK